MNKQLESTLLKFKQNNINTLDIVLGSYLNKNIFNKKLDENYFKTILENILDKNYSKKQFNVKVYNYGINFLEYYSKKHFKNTNVNRFITNNNLYITYLSTEEQHYNFPCKKDYHILEQSILEFKINDEICIKFINNNQIKINVKLNHNIDLSIEKLKDLFKFIN